MLDTILLQRTQQPALPPDAVAAAATHLRRHTRKSAPPPAAGARLARRSGPAGPAHTPWQPAMALKGQQRRQVRICNLQTRQASCAFSACSPTQSIRQAPLASSQIYSTARCSRTANCTCSREKAVNRVMAPSAAQPSSRGPAKAVHQWKRGMWAAKQSDHPASCCCPGWAGMWAAKQCVLYVLLPWMGWAANHGTGSRSLSTATMQRCTAHPAPHHTGSPGRGGGSQSRAPTGQSCRRSPAQQ